MVQLRYEDGDGAREIDVVIERPNASVADLALVLGAPSPRLSIDGRPVPGDERLGESGLVGGSTVRPADHRSPSAAPALVWLRVVGGPAAGGSFPLGPGSAIIGRRSDAAVRIDDPAISREHCRLDINPAGLVSVTDLGSRNGTDVNGEALVGTVALGPDDVVALGGAILIRVVPATALGPVVSVDPVREASPAGTLPFTRAPRAAGTVDTEPISLPVKPTTRSGVTFSVATLVGPLVMAGAFVVISKDVRYAAIAALTPLMFLANFVEDRTKGRRSMRRGVREFTARLERLRETLRVRRAVEIAHRRAVSPDPAEALFRAQAPSVRLWERRPSAPDFGDVAIGTATVPWTPPLSLGQGGDAAPEVAAVLRQMARLSDVPVEVGLSAGGVVGLRGRRTSTTAVARSLLCQATVSAGPADLVVAVFADTDRVTDWDWAKWLPHTVDRRSGGSARLLAAGAEEADRLAGFLLSAGAEAVGREDAAEHAAPLILVVVDGRSLLEGRPCPLRELLAGRGGPVAGIVITDRLPAVCSSTLEIAEDGMAVLERFTLRDTVTGVLPTGMPERFARDCARAMARFEDPELHARGAGLPDAVTLLPLLGMEQVGGDAVVGRWRAGAADLRATAVLGVSEKDVFGIDLDDDGPHGLIAGTTGSGKSELLRTLVASLAMNNDPEHLTFALVDYKGGGALDECARLPHSVGLVTDLDEQLGARALRCLQAELRHREHLLRQAGLSHVRDYQRLRDTERPELEPMPRLVVVIDEFATLVKALPDFVDNLVGIAQLGRSLGMHLIMATQRPAGSVNDAIKNNVKLRIALRLESASDSQDVIDDAAAAGIGGRQWGRAFYRVSTQEVLPVQTALSTGVSAARDAAGPVTVTPFRFEREHAANPGGPAPDGPTDLQRLVAAANEAFASLGARPPRQPWPEPLPTVVAAGDLADPAARGLQGEAAGLPALALADDPDRQTQYAVGWDPGAGNLLLYGVVGAGTTSALAALALATARRHAPDELHLYVLDMDAGDLSPLAGLPHTGAYVGVAERERRLRLVRLLRDELDRRKASGGAGRPTWLVLIDNLGAFIADHDKDLTGMRLIEDLQRVYADGPAVGILIAATADRAGSVPGPWAALTQQKLVFRLADAGEYGYFDVPRGGVPAFVPGRAVVAASGQVIQLAWPGEDLTAAVAEVGALRPHARRVAPRVGVLPAGVQLSELTAVPRVTGDPWWLPLGVGDTTLEPAGLTLYEGEHALIAGPARSGRSTALCAIAAVLTGRAGAPAVLGYAPRRSPLRDAPGLARLVTDYEALDPALEELSGRPLVVLVDDADSVDDPHGVLNRLVSSNVADMHVVAAGRADALRRAYGHWTHSVRDSHCGVLLIPDHDLDGDLLGVGLPRTNRMAATPGRGYLVSDGTLDGVQVAQASR
ncbi:FtsK/SpoIIIE domain-containing protein [Actinoallomurus sp. NPDC052308]|uniref:FtsK/SpoIIIE domain-containing protein n=1 Tax=Actinoallomurus sp. NPDC052308 TaxID=3155530 RepID=UPI00341E6BF5